MEKIKISQDQLRNYLESHHIKNAALAKRMGVSEAIVSGSFRHTLNRHGKPLKFSAANIVKLNAALEQIAQELLGCKLEFSPPVVPGKKPSKFDKELVPVVQRIGEYMKLNGMLLDVLGWDKRKCDNIVSVGSSLMYGHITKENAERINTEVLAVAATLMGWEVVASEEE